MSLKRLAGLDAEQDHLAISRIMGAELWTFDSTRAIELALLKTFAIPSISRILVRSGEFLDRTQKRYDDTDILLSAMMEKGYDSPEGKKALHRINQLHSMYPIDNEQMLYVLGTFVMEPLHWNRRFGWRPWTETESRAVFRTWMEIGRRMGIRDLFATPEGMAEFYEEYERAEMVWAPQNRLLYDKVVPVIIDNLPRALASLVPAALPVIMGRRMRRAFRIPDPPPHMTPLVTASLRLRGRAAQLLPQKPFYRLRLPRRSYPAGFDLSVVGARVKKSRRSQARTTAGAESTPPP